VLEVGWDDQEPQETREGKFVLLNTVCDKHKPLATTMHRADHQELTKVPLSHIEDAKRININGVVVRMANEGQRSPRIMKQLRQGHSQVLKFNQDLDEKRGELVSQPYAFDSHIYEQILKENQAKQIA
jgi:predicted nucleotide-binding protein (sugar kinase/HSP70/actin superfamily)